MNPYASFLAGRNPREVIAETAGRLAATVEKLGPEGLRRSPAPGKWPTAAILCHLADCETVFAFRLRQALAEERHVIQPFDQDRWAEQYPDADAALALAVFTAVRNWNLALLDRLSPEQFARTLNHPERGEMTFQTVVETMAGHDLNHLAQLEKIASLAASA